MIRFAAFLAACALSLHALGQAFPNKPLKIVVGYPPGGSGDFLTRMAADELAKDFGVPVVFTVRLSKKPKTPSRP